MKKIAPKPLAVEPPKKGEKKGILDTTKTLILDGSTKFSSLIKRDLKNVL